jgi:metal-sulfur cluster biosynthetic enzyme
MTALHDTSEASTVTQALWAALGTVRDPELDEPITDLAFVSEYTVDDSGAARVRLRLPTYFCAPNFAYLMVADAHDAAIGVAGIDAVDVRLEDHFASDEINAGMAAQSGFTGTFAEQAADDDLDELRRVFHRKAHLASLDRVCRRLMADGTSVHGLAELHLSDVPESAERDGLLRRRADLGLPNDNGQPLLVDEHGTRIGPEQVTPFLRFAKTTRVSIEGNSSFCRGLLDKRYGVQRPAS